MTALQYKLSRMKNLKLLIPSALLGLLMIIFGLNKFIGFIAVDPPKDLTAQNFMGAMFTSYLFVVVGILEVAAGVLLIIPRTTFLGWLLIAPVIFNIVAFHIAHDFIGNGIWLLPTLIFVFVGLLQRQNLNSVMKAGNHG